MGAKATIVIQWSQVKVSIHAPVMGANTGRDIVYAEILVSIHAPVMGAKNITRQSRCVRRFNPRTRDGCEYLVADVLLCAIVSIHAPVMGAHL